MVVDGEALVRESHVQHEAVRGGVGQPPGAGYPGARKGVIDERHPGDASVGRLDVGQLVAELTGKEQPVVLAAERITLRQPGYRAVEPVAVENDVVGRRQLVGNAAELGLGVVVVEGQLSDLIAM